MERRLRESFYLLWMIAIILCAAAALISALFVSFTKAPVSETAAVETTLPEEDAAIQFDTESDSNNEAVPEATPEPTPEPSPSPTPEPGPTILEETPDMGEEYLASCIFLGDSTTYGLAAYDALPFTQVWSTSIGTMDLSAQSYVDIDVYHEDGSVQSLSIRDAAAQEQPEYLIVTLGINGISYMDEESFKTEYIDLIQGLREASPQTKIILQSIFPVIDYDAPIGINNAGVMQANEWVLSIAEQTGVRYLNTHDALMDENGELLDEYCNGDGVHLDYPGCMVVLNSVRTHGYR